MQGHDDHAIGQRATLTTLVVGACGVSALYLLLTPERPNRGPLFVVLALALLALVAAPRLLPGRLPLHRARYVGTAVAYVLITAGVALDQRPRSPLTLLFSLLLVHASLTYPVRAVVVLGAVQSVLSFVTTQTEVGPGEALVVSAFLALVTVACALIAGEFRARARLLEELASTDGLTGCLTYRAFHQRLGEELTRARRHDRALSLLLVDIDHFKAVNDTYGHRVGDEVLVRLARALREGARATDAIGRLGGEEFALLLPETDGQEAGVLAERMRAEAATLGPPHVTVSIGVSTYPDPAATAEDLLVLADHALYDAKHAGRNRVGVGVDRAAVRGR